MPGECALALGVPNDDLRGLTTRLKKVFRELEWTYDHSRLWWRKKNLRAEFAKSDGFIDKLTEIFRGAQKTLSLTEPGEIAVTFVPKLAEQEPLERVQCLLRVLRGQFPPDVKKVLDHVFKKCEGNEEMHVDPHLLSWLEQNLTEYLTFEVHAEDAPEERQMLILTAWYTKEVLSLLNHIRALQQAHP